MARKNLTIEQFIKKAIRKHGNKYNYEKVKYSGVFNKVCIICLTHGEFWQTPSVHYLNGCGCPKCRNSKIENEVNKILDFNLIENKKSYRKFNWLRNPKTNYPLELDFYLPEYNIAIECQGEQHFNCGDTWFGCNDKMKNQKALKEIQERDKIKKELCEKNNLPLYYIRYDDNVEEKLNEIIDCYGM